MGVFCWITANNRRCQAKQPVFSYFEHMKKVQFGKKLKELRAYKKITQAELAKKLGVGESTIRGWENKNIQTSFEVLVKLADLFEVTTDYLLGRTEF